VPLLRLCASVLASDAEENALVAIRITSELHKAFRPALEQEAMPFLAHVATMYTQFAATCTYHFEGPGAAPPPAGGADGAGSLAGDATAGGDDAPRPLIPALRSFRVITDAPLIVMFIFQLYPRLMAAHMPSLLPAMVEAVALRGPTPEALPFHLRPAYAELRAAQVKTVSFVTFLLRVLSDALRTHAPRLSTAVVHLLLTCPDVVATRKELLVATRHMLGTEFRAAFAPHTDTLLSEHALLGTGRAAHEALRPLAFSLLVRAAPRGYRRVWVGAWGASRRGRSVARACGLRRAAT
jgi:transformation/transcription domain-associated protein